LVGSIRPPVCPPTASVCTAFGDGDAVHAQALAGTEVTGRTAVFDGIIG
jgi:hypothetical protein